MELVKTIEMAAVYHTFPRYPLALAKLERIINFTLSSLRFAFMTIILTVMLL